MNTNMTWFEWFSKIFASLCFGGILASALEGLSAKTQNQRTPPLFVLKKCIISLPSEPPQLGNLLPATSESISQVIVYRLGYPDHPNRWRHKGCSRNATSQQFITKFSHGAQMIPLFRVVKLQGYLVTHFITIHGEGQGLSQDLETGCLKLAIVEFLGIQIFKGNHNIHIHRFQ